MLSCLISKLFARFYGGYFHFVTDKITTKFTLPKKFAKVQLFIEKRASISAFFQKKILPSLYDFDYFCVLIKKQTMYRRFTAILIAIFLGMFLITNTVHAQVLNEILLHFSEEEMNVPMSVREKMMAEKGNTLLNYDNYKLLVYDKRAGFLQLRTPLDVTYEIATWRRDGHGDLLVALCETRCGNSCGSKISFYAVTKDAEEDTWQQLPTEDYIPTFTLSDIFNEQKLSKNYLTTETVLKDFEVKTQFMLPQTGHDIIVIFTCLDELDKKEYQRIYKYLDGVMLDLIWKKGSFIKSDPYFPAY
jgi:hypothetical protein